jgi:tetratricopeptide (TPR) repeat protein
MALMRPSPVAQSFEEAKKLHRAGRLDAAEKIYRKVLEAQPDEFNSLRLLGVIEHQRGNYTAAVRQIEAALAANPNFAEAFNSLGIAVGKLKRLDEAVVNFDRAIALNPAYAKAFYNRGGALHELKRFNEAVASYDQAIALNPAYAAAYNNRGNALKELMRQEEALASYNQAIALNPRFADAFKNRGAVLQELWRLEEAVVSYDQAIAFKPDYAAAFNNRGSALHELLRLDQALANYDRAIALRPDFANAHVNRGMTRLLIGRLQEGWEDLEWRWRCNGLPCKHTAIDAEIWQGQPLAGRRLVIFAEQGLGDAIQFSRYLPLLVDRGAMVTFLVPAKLVRLLRQLSPEIAVVGTLKNAARFDFQYPLMSVPLHYGTTMTSIPRSVPYLSADTDSVARWAKRLGSQDLKIGIAWQGNPDRRLDWGRSIPLAEFVPLARLPNVRLISLQKKHGLDQCANLPAGVKMEILSDELDSGPDAFMDTAAVMGNLDLIITSDTSIAHLAGALGRPTWVALKRVPDWRWLLERADCPWYPTMRLFRQQMPGDWKSVFLRIKKELHELLTQNV